MSDSCSLSHFTLFIFFIIFLRGGEAHQDMPAIREFGITCRRSTTDQMNRFMCCTDIPSVL